MAETPPAPPAPPLQFTRTRTGRLNYRRRGLPRTRFADLYLSLFSRSWPRLFGTLFGVYLTLNLAYGLLYWLIGGIDGASTPVDYLSFSVQTFATIGYGVFHPVTPLANFVVMIEAFNGLVAAGLATGLMFAKFSRPHARVTFSKVMVVNRRNGVPYLVFRMANERASEIVDARMHVFVLREETTAEGDRMRRFHELRLERNHSPVFNLSWAAMHPMDDHSPLRGLTAQNVHEKVTAITVILTGIDETFAQAVHGRYYYTPDDIQFDAKFEDMMLSEEGELVIDHDKLHRWVPVDAPPDRAVAPAPPAG